METLHSTALSLKRSVVTRLFRYSVTLDRLNWTARWAESVQSGEWCPIFETREQMYLHINDSLENGAPMDYLEFGVAAGDSLKSWCGIHSNPKSHFFGFDSFRGLPADWKKGRPKGCFSTDGKPPEIDDPRIAFVPGLFQQSLPEFLAGFQHSSRIVIHNDSDLYSSTLFCLTTLDKLIVQDTIIIFDRVRENLRKNRREPLYNTLNRSVNETLPRSILTHATALAATLALLFFAGEVIRPFAWVMAFGIVTGTFSSIYVASPILLWIETKYPRENDTKVKKAKPVTA